MKEYLIGIMYHEPEAWKLWNDGLMEDYESSTGLFVKANSEDEAISWGGKVGEALLRFVNKDESLNWEEIGYRCWNESDIENSGWSHCISFFQHVAIGEMPDFAKMTTSAYEKWSKDTGTSKTNT
jgi:hypothetical protein